MSDYLDFPNAPDVTLEPAARHTQITVDTGGGVLKALGIERRSENLGPTVTPYCAGCRTSYVTGAALVAAHQVDPKTLARRFGPHVWALCDAAFTVALIDDTHGTPAP